MKGVGRVCGGVGGGEVWGGEGIGNIPRPSLKTPVYLLSWTGLIQRKRPHDGFWKERQTEGVCVEEFETLEFCDDKLIVREA